MKKSLPRNKGFFNSGRWLLTIFTSLLMLQAAATIRRVDAGSPFPSAPGDSWNFAYNNLQNAINASSSGDEIWIKAGTYQPTNTSNDNFSFHMKSGVKIYGGFNGTETLLSQRNFTANVVILTSIPTEPIIENSNVNSAALLDGVQLVTRGGSVGGGMYNAGTTFPAISNVIFSNAVGNASSGTVAALYIEGGNASVSNVSFNGNYASNGGAIYMKNCTSTFTNVVFSRNGSNGKGGAMYCEESVPNLVNCVFDGNYTAGTGGAVYCLNTNNTTRKPTFTNVVFYSNKSTNNNGGAIYADRSEPVIINCTFALNQCGTGNGIRGAGVYTTNADITITNCVFKSNTKGTSTTLTDIAAQGSINTGAVSYSSFTETATISGMGNTGAVATPFTDINDGNGSDGVWMNSDDGLRLLNCNAFSLIDKGSNSANTMSTDIRGFTRRINVDFIPDGGSDTAPIIDMGAYEDNNDFTTLLSITGSVGTSHTVPFPKELAADTIKNIQSPTLGGTITYKWQSTTDTINNAWADASGTNTAAFYILPNLSQTTYYRRAVINSFFCSNNTFYSNVVRIKVVTPNGAISGKVSSRNGTGVQGIVISITRQTTISGSPVNYTYKDTTGNDGKYSINPIYYGDPSLGNVSATFIVTPSKPGHGFNLMNSNVQLSTNTPQISNIDFTDTTVLSITGRTYQQCADCIPANQTCPIDSVTIYKDNLYATITGFIDTAYGRYGLSVTDPVQVKVEPRFTGHSFAPAFLNITPVNNVAGADFKDTTTHTISGRLTAGCGNYIGMAVLEYTDVLPNASNGSVRSSCFRKQVTTNGGSGFYSIRLPARKYSVRVISFTPALSSTSPAYVLEAELKDFVNTKMPKDSLTRDISKGDSTLNIVYQRPPVLRIASGLNIICSAPQDFALIRQNEADSFKVIVYQGDVSLGCPLATDTGKIRITTNVQNEDQLEELRYAVADTGTKVKLKGGIPNITGNYLKDLNVYFTDKYGRPATQLNRKVLVTGVKPDAATFTTVSPQIPLMVLHDPPGDASFSNWRSSQSVQNALRFYTAKGGGGTVWAEAKIGAKASVGIGVEIEQAGWGIIRGSVGVSATGTSSNETIITTTTSQDFSTANNANVIGPKGDVYIGAALNLIYSTSTEIGYNNCAVTSSRKLVIADDGFNTEYIYSEDYIVNTLIPNLQSLAQLQPDSASRYLDQVRVWQQVVDNNAENKRRAAFVQNYSFDGSVGPYTNTTTTSSTKTSTIEFKMEIDAQLALEIGAEIAGSGLRGGVEVNCKVETGKSESNTTTTESTMSYTLDDDDPGDYFSVNVKKDPVYNSPMFELAAGTASCPSEPVAQPRDAVSLTAQNPVLQNVNPANPATFNLKVVNTSASSSTNPNDKRTYKLNYVQSSNVANETITIAGSPYQSSAPYILAPLGYLDSTIIPVSITRQNGSSVYSYEGERFTVISDCGDDLGKTVAVSAYFTAPCSSIALSQPVDGWVIASASNNQLFIKPTGYDPATLTSVNLQYSNGTGTAWSDGPFVTPAQLASGFNFDVSSLPEGATNIRLRLDCNTGTVYSQRATGIIDRKAPQLFGIPDPTDDNYVNGDIIGFTYNEKLNTNPAGLQVTVRRLSNNALLPATASIYENKIIITPDNPITAFTGDSIRVIVSGVKDVYGNVKLKADTTRFTVGTTVPATGNQALFVTANNPAGNRGNDTAAGHLGYSRMTSNPTVYKNDDTGSIKVVFNLPANAINDTRVNFSIGGTARYNVDYTVSYTGAEALYTGFNGATGAIKIPAGSRQATLTLKPITGDTSLSPDKTIIISTTEGGDYTLGATTVATGIITSEDGISTYTFTGDGNFNIKNNWLNGKMPLTTLATGKEIIINPSGTCVLNIPVTVRSGAKITVKQNRRFVIQGNLKLN